MNTCQKCQQNPAHISYTENINGNIKQVFLCFNCIKEYESLLAVTFNDILSISDFQCGHTQELLENSLKKLEKNIFQSLFSNLFGHRLHKSIKTEEAKPKDDQSKIQNIKIEFQKLLKEEKTAVQEQNFKKAAEIKQKKEELLKELIRDSFKEIPLEG